MGKASPRAGTGTRATGAGGLTATQVRSTCTTSSSVLLGVQLSPDWIGVK